VRKQCQIRQNETELTRKLYISCNRTEWLKTIEFPKVFENYHASRAAAQSQFPASRQRLLKSQNPLSWLAVWHISHIIFSLQIRSQSNSLLVPSIYLRLLASVSQFRWSSRFFRLPLQLGPNYYFASSDLFANHGSRAGWRPRSTQEISQQVHANRSCPGRTSGRTKISIHDLGIYCFCLVLGPPRWPLRLAVHPRARYQRPCYHDFLLRLRSQIPKAWLLYFLRLRLGLHGEHLLGVLAEQGLDLLNSCLGRNRRAFDLSLDDISTCIRVNLRRGLSSSWAHVCGK